MRGDGARNVDTDGGDFSCLLFCVGTGLCPVRAGRRPAPTRSSGPNPSETRNPLSRDPEVGAGTDQYFFKLPDVFDRAEGHTFSIRPGETSQIEHWIGHEP